MIAKTCQHPTVLYIEHVPTQRKYTFSQGTVLRQSFVGGTVTHCTVSCKDCGWSKTWHINHAPVWVRALYKVAHAAQETRSEESHP